MPKRVKSLAKLVLLAIALPVCSQTNGNIRLSNSYGCKGDGTAVDTTCIKNLLHDCLVVDGGGTCIISSGTYKLDATIVNSNISGGHILCSDRGTTFTWSGSSTAPMFL